MNDGGPAFPTHGKFDSINEGIRYVPLYGGMTLRNWFAAMASFEEVRILAEFAGVSYQRARFIIADRMIEEMEKE